MCTVVVSVKRKRNEDAAWQRSLEGLAKAGFDLTASLRACGHTSPSDCVSASAPSSPFGFINTRRSSLSQIHAQVAAILTRDEEMRRGEELRQEDEERKRRSAAHDRRAVA